MSAIGLKYGLLKRRHVLPGFRLSLGFTLFYAAYAYLFHIAYDRLRPVMPVQSEGAVALPRPVIVSS